MIRRPGRSGVKACAVWSSARERSTTISPGRGRRPRAEGGGGRAAGRRQSRTLQRRAWPSCGWSYVALRLLASAGNELGVRYVGRPERASPAEGYKTTHDVEQARIIQEVLAPATTGDAKRTSAV